MADYDIFREQMGIMFPKYGHALWDPSPWKPNRPAQVGDVGFIRMGKFHCLFNILRPKDEQANVPEGYEPLVLKSSPHITERSLNSAHYCSVGVGVDVEQDKHLAGPDDPRKVSMKCSRRRGGALLSLPVNARREDTLAQKAFGEWMVKHIDHWLAFAQELQLGVEHMEEIILVTGCDRTRSWTNIAFLEGQVDAKGTYREKVVERVDGSIELQFSSGHVAGGVLSHGPQGKNLPEDQCVFIRGFRVGRTSKIFPKRLGAAAYPSPEPERYGTPVVEPMSIPATTRYQDPLHVLLDYIAERAYGCDMVLVHDDDLERIDGIGEGSSLESLEPEMVMDLLQGSDMEIHKVCCDLSSTGGGPSSDIGVVWVAMLSTSTKTWNSVLPPQPLSPAAHLQNPGLSPCRASASPMSSPSAVPDSSSVPPIPGDASRYKEFATHDDPHSVLKDLWKSASLSRLGSVFEINLPILDKIGASPSGMWSSLGMLAHGGRHQLVAIIAVAFFAGALFGWMFSSYWLDISKHWDTNLSASFALYLWFERKHTSRMLGEIHERMGVLQHHFMSLQSSPTVTAAADARNDHPIMTKIAPADREMTGQSTQFIVQLAIAGPSGHGEPRVEISHAHQSVAATPQESTRNTVVSESSIVNLGGGAAEQHIEHPGSSTVSGSGSICVAEPSRPHILSNAGSSSPSAAGDLSQFGKVEVSPISRTPSPHIPAELPIKLSEQESLRADTTLPPSPECPRKRPDPLDLQSTINTNVAPPLPSVLANARHIEDITRITYPQGIKRPKLELNINTQKGQFRYDREFLLQFMHICKEKPDNLPPVVRDVIGLESRNRSHTMSRSGSDPRNTLSMSSDTQSPPTGLGSIPDSMGKTASSGFQLGRFSTSASKMSSEERFLAASAGLPVSVVGGPPGSSPPAMDRTISQIGTGRNHTRSKRGANDSSHINVAGDARAAAPISTMGPPMEPVAPLEMSANRWVATSTRRNGPGVDSDSPEMVERKVKALLNKLTMERFDSISDQIIAWANKSEREKDGRTLIQVIRLIFETATDEKSISATYARLCCRMVENISPKVQDDGIKNAEGQPFAGGQLFRKHLLSRCQEDFERGWVAKETTAAAAAPKATEDRAVKEGNEKAYLDEYYAAAKAKRRGMGLIRLIGELFKRQMLTERIIHECIKKFLGNAENPEEEEIESLCKLLTTVGSPFDTRKARAHLDVYFSRMRELTKNKNVNARMVFMLLDVIELRERRWRRVPYKAVDLAPGVPSDLVPQRRTLLLLPRSKPVGEESTASTPAVPESSSEQDEAAGQTGSLAPATMLEAKTKSKIDEDADEFLGIIRMLGVADSYFSSLPPEHRHWLVDSLVTKSIEMKEQDVKLVSELFVRVREKELCSPAAFEEGFDGLAEALDDLAIDIPKAWSYFAMLLRGSGLDQDEERRGRIAAKIMDAEKLNRLL